MPSLYDPPLMSTASQADAPALSVDVVIVAFNRFDLTESCLRHLGAQTREHRVIFVDDGSTDGTSERLIDAWPEVSVERLPVNAGFAHACNHGARASTGDVIVLLNNDVDCRPEFLERLVAPLEEDPSLGSVAALSLQPGEQTIDSIGMTADPTLAAFQRRHGRPIAEAPGERPVLAGPAGAAAAYRRAAWEQVGGLEEALVAYMEDFDLALRLRCAGWRTTAATAAAGIHLGSATYGHRSPWQRRQGGFARAFMLRRYGVLKRRIGVRALATEVLVVAGDVALSRDLMALRGRIEGWRAARGAARMPWPPAQAIERGIGFRASLDLRRGVYSRVPN